jgi:hypothetical protein
MRLGQACAPEAVPPCLHYDGQANIVAAEFVQVRCPLSNGDGA